ncbi:MAG: phosphoribosylglycinamide formyltransferase [Verrucomicrobiota bacterium]
MNATLPLKIAVLGSGKGSNFIALHRSIRDQSLPVEVVLVASDFEDAGIIEYARSEDFPVYTCRSSRFKTRLETEIEVELVEALQVSGAELIVLAGFMRVIKTPLLESFAGRVINIHPSLLPQFKGLKAWEQALAAGVSETGCSVHWVDASLDGGAVIAQKTVPVLPQDTADSLYQRIQVQEHILLPEVIGQLAAERPFDS